MSTEPWKTAITKVEPNKILVRGYRVDELMGKISFGQAVYLLLRGELPSRNVGRLMEAMLVSSIDHGVTPPSTLAAMTVASTGSTLNAALATGVLAINKFHGGAIEDCMRFLQEVWAFKAEKKLSAEEAAATLIRQYREQKKRISGFGHRYHTQDPRTRKLFSMAKELGIAGEFVDIAEAVEAELQKALGKKLPINVDGAIATLLCELEFPPALANAFFIMARMPGWVAHIYEEQTRQKPMRVIEPRNYEYDGPEERPVPEESL